MNLAQFNLSEPQFPSLLDGTRIPKSLDHETMDFEVSKSIHLCALKAISSLPPFLVLPSSLALPLHFPPLCSLSSCLCIAASHMYSHIWLGVQIRILQPSLPQLEMAQVDCI